MNQSQSDYEDIHRDKKSSTLKYIWAKMSNPQSYDPEKAIVLSTADMQFKFSPQILQKAKESLSNNVDFGYQNPEKQDLQTIKSWVTERYWKTNPQLQQGNLIIWSGMLHLFHAVLDGFINENESVLIFAPSYHMFYHMMEESNISVVQYFLKVKNNRYFIDWKELQTLFLKNNIKLIVWCSPHNPSGRIWSKEELLQLCNLAKKYKSTIFSDQIYSDSIIDHKKFTSFLDIEQSHQLLIYANSHTKAFNCSGNGCAYTIALNPQINGKLKTLAQKHLSFSTFFSRKLLISCYKFGMKWLTNTQKYVQNNVKFICQYFKMNLPKTIVFEYECSYLIVVDFKEYVPNHQILSAAFKKHQIYPSYLSDFYATKTSSTMIRINLAANIKIVEQFSKRVVLAIEEVQPLSKIQ